MSETLRASPTFPFIDFDVKNVGAIIIRVKKNNRRVVANTATMEAIEHEQRKRSHKKNRKEVAGKNENRLHMFN